MDFEHWNTVFRTLSSPRTENKLEFNPVTFKSIKMLHFSVNYFFFKQKTDTKNTSKSRRHVGLRIHTQNLQCYTGVTF